MEVPRGRLWTAMGGDCTDHTGLQDQEDPSLVSG